MYKIYRFFFNLFKLYLFVCSISFEKFPSTILPPTRRLSYKMYKKITP